MSRKEIGNKVFFLQERSSNKTRSPSFLGFSLIFRLVRFLLFTPKNERCFVLLNHDSCHEKYKSNYHVTNCQIIINNTIHCFVIFIIILVIKQIGLPLRGRPILLITRMITDRIGLHLVLLPLLTIMRIPEINRDYLATKLGVKQ